MADKKKNRFGSVLGFIVAAIAVIIFIAFYADNFIFYIKDVTAKSKHTKDEAVAALENATDIHFKGDLDRVNNKALITIDDELYANTLETGLVDMKFALKCNKDVIFYFKFYNAADGEFGDEEPGTSYAVYNDKNEINAYVQESLCNLPDGTRDFVYNFYDVNKKRTSVYFNKNTNTLYDWSDGRKLLEFSIDFSGITKIYNIEMIISDPEKVDLTNIFLAFLEVEGELTDKKNHMDL